MLQRSKKENLSMFGKFAEQLKQSSQPVSAMVAVIAKALEAVSKQQAAFVSGMLSDSVIYLNSAAKQGDIKGVIAAQAAYSESVRDRFTTASSGTLSALSEARDNLSKLMSQTIAAKPTETVPPQKIAATKPKAPSKTAATAKPTTEKKTTPVSNPAAKSSTAVPSKPATTKSATATKKATATKTTAKRTSSTTSSKGSGAATK
jgi:hypothetical protein